MLRPVLPNFGSPNCALSGLPGKTEVAAGQRFRPWKVLQPEPSVLDISTRWPLAKIENGGPLWTVMSVFTCQPPTSRSAACEMSPA